MKDPFESPKSGLVYARERLAEFNGACQRFFDAKPYAVFQEPDVQPGYEIVKTKLSRPMPSRWPHDAFCIFNTIRSTLDQCGWAAARLAKNIGGNTYFPFADSEADVDRMRTGRCKDVPPDIFTLFRAFKPYKGGDDLLWSLNQATNASKHRFIVPVLSDPGSVRIIERAALTSRNDVIPFKPKWDAVKDEMPLFRVGAGSQGQYEVQYTLHVAMGDVGVLGGKPLSAAIDALLSKADRIVSATEAECARIGLLPQITL